MNTWNFWYFIDENLKVLSDNILKALSNDRIQTENELSKIEKQIVEQNNALASIQHALDRHNELIKLLLVNELSRTIEIDGNSILIDLLNSNSHEVEYKAEE